MLTGAVPFAGRNVREVLFEQLCGPDPLPSRRRPEVPPVLDDIVRRASAREPADRYPDIASMRRAIERAAAALAPGALPYAVAMLPEPDIDIDIDIDSADGRVGGGGASSAHDFAQQPRIVVERAE